MPHTFLNVLFSLSCRSLVGCYGYAGARFWHSWIAVPCRFTAYHTTGFRWCRVSFHPGLPQQLPRFLPFVPACSYRSPVTRFVEHRQTTHVAHLPLRRRLPGSLDTWVRCATQPAFTRSPVTYHGFPTVAVRSTVHTRMAVLAATVLQEGRRGGRRKKEENIESK